LRLIESAPFKLWLAQMRKERIDEVFKLEIAIICKIKEKI